MHYIRIFSAVICLIFLFTVNSYSQISWKEILPAEIDLPTDTENYAQFSISASDENNATVIGYIFHDAAYPNSRLSHFIKRTTNGGTSWDEQNNGLPDFYDIANAKLMESVYAMDSMNI